MTNLKEGSKSSNELYAEYIKFVIGNGYNFFKGNDKWGIPEQKVQRVSKDHDLCYFQVECIQEYEDGEKYYNDYPLLELITSQEFIQAVKNGVRVNGFYNYKKTYRNGAVKTIGYTNIDSMNDFDLLNMITSHQAIAIRDGTLDNFIKDILNIK